ncbi:head-tail connector protein [Clostridium tyrobutyricum]|uniref:head-tail connector protein n=1 Tax=Clostridium tyrobutyricum TaxID=1519 RepID=UPI001C382B05|nr:head-tail connector protein [Clostridium tyrobutyricum]MBV4417466.1 head-tail connector protein [Clostridium tyrobutyricum]
MTLEQIKEFLHVDYEDDDVYIQNLIDVAQNYIDKCCGESYKADDKLVKLSELALQKLINDMYNNRTQFIPNNVQKDNIINTIFDLLGNAEGEE